MSKRISCLSRRLQATIAVGILVIALGGTAAASGLINGRSIVNHSITGAKLAKGSIQLSDLSPAAQNALKGARGPQGPAGTNGANGKDGATGATGASGAKGALGDQGPAGPGLTDAAVGVYDASANPPTYTVMPTLGSDLSTGFFDGSETNQQAQSTFTVLTARDLSQCAIIVTPEGGSTGTASVDPDPANTNSTQITVDLNADETFSILVSCPS